MINDSFPINKEQFNALVTKKIPLRNHSHHRPNLSTVVKTQSKKHNLPKIIPSQPKSKESFRVWYSPRAEMSEAPIIVIRFEGVLGSYTKKSLWDTKTQRHTVPNMITGLRKLRQSFQLILTCCLSSKQVKEVISIMTEEGVIPDAIYIKSDSIPLSYSQIVIDFAIGRRAERLIVSLMLIIGYSSSSFRECRAKNK